MDKQLIIWLVLTVIILTARFTRFDRWVSVVGQIGYWKPLWNGKWIKGVPVVWFVLSAVIYLAK